MKIAIVSHLYPSQTGFKHGTFIREHARLVAGFGKTKVWVPTPRHPFFYGKSKFSASPLIQSPEATRWRYWSLPRHFLASIVAKQYRLLAKQINIWQPELVHVHWAFPDAQVVPYLKLFSLPTVVQVHGSDWYRTRHVQRIRNKALSAADAVVTVGKQLNQDIATEMPDLTAKLHHIPNGVDPDRFTIPDNKTTIRKKLGWDLRRRHLLCVANLKEEKGIIDLMDALFMASRSDIDVHLVGTDFKDRYSEQVKAKAGLLKQGNVHFHPPVPPEELPDFYKASDLFVLPSRKEGFGISLIEAGACGLPLLSTKSGGPEEIITDTCGIITDKQAPQLLAKAIDQMTDRADSFSPEEIRRDIISRYSKTVIVNQYQKLYRSIIS